MTTTTSTLSRRLSSNRLTFVGIVGFALAVAAASQVAIPLPGTPVPFTLQPMLVVLAGLWLGPTAGAASMIVYLAAGAVGLPVFTPLGAPGLARFVGPTGGYLLAYPAAAFVAGVLARGVRSLPVRWLAAAAGMCVIYLGGIAQLAVLNASVTRAVVLGVTPFALFDIVKAFVAAAASGSWTMRPRA